MGAFGHHSNFFPSLLGRWGVLLSECGRDKSGQREGLRPACLSGPEGF